MLMTMAKYTVIMKCKGTRLSPDESEEAESTFAHPHLKVIWNNSDDSKKHIARTMSIAINQTTSHAVSNTSVIFIVTFIIIFFTINIRFYEQ